MTNQSSGQGLVEYTIILALIALVCVISLRTLGEAPGPKLDEASSALENSAPATF